jgi:hypothetical protein
MWAGRGAASGIHVPTLSKSSGQLGVREKCRERLRRAAGRLGATAAVACVPQARGKREEKGSESEGLSRKQRGDARPPFQSIGPPAIQPRPDQSTVPNSELLPLPPPLPQAAKPLPPSPEATGQSQLLHAPSAPNHRPLRASQLPRRKKQGDPQPGAGRGAATAGV